MHGHKLVRMAKIEVLLDTKLVTSSGSSSFEWNVTYAAQKSMRNAESLDLIFAVIPSSASSESALFASHFHPQSTNHPTLKIIYIPGSDEYLLNQFWNHLLMVNLCMMMISLISPNSLPQFEWNHTSSLPISGWAIELDVSDSFDTNNLRSFTSWNDGGFDLTNLTFSILPRQNQLTVGEQYHWRVRALYLMLINWVIGHKPPHSQYQININQLTSDRFSVTLSILKHYPVDKCRCLLILILIDSPQPIFQANHSSETTMLVGTTNTLAPITSSLLRLSSTKN